MKILFCSPQEINQSMGISRVLIEIKNELNRKGHNCELVGPKEIGCTLPYSTKANYLKHYSTCLKKYIQQNGMKFDVIDVDHEFLPFSRSDFSSKLVIVARTVLLVQHLQFITFPQRKNLRYFLGQIFKHYQRTLEQRFRIDSANKTLACVDLINVPNYKDKDLLISCGFPKEKIIVLPYGFSPEKTELFKNTTSLLPSTLKICFIGTFDYRKGAMHFAQFLDIVSQTLPEVTLKLIGCKGMFQSEADILSFFPTYLHTKIEIVLSFERDQIANQLSDCALGIFPSYLEGFPFGILEMMAANIPVISFDAPGAGMMVPHEHLAPVGDIKTLALKAIHLLSKPDYLVTKRMEAKKITEKFTWEIVGKETIIAYQRILNNH